MEHQCELGRIPRTCHNIKAGLELEESRITLLTVHVGEEMVYIQCMTAHPLRRLSFIFIKWSTATVHAVINWNHIDYSLNHMAPSRKPQLPWSYQARRDLYIDSGRYLWPFFQYIEAGLINTKCTEGVSRWKGIILPYGNNIL